MATKEQLELLQQITKEMQLQAEFLPKVKEAFAASGSELSNILNLHKSLKEEISSTEGLNAKEIERQQNFISSMKERIQLAIEMGDLTASEGEEKIKNLDTTEKQLDLLKERETIARSELDTSLKKNVNLLNIRGRFQEIADIGNLRLTQEELIGNRMQFSHMVVASMLEKLTQYAGKLLDFAVEVDTAARQLMRGASFSYEEARRGLVDITATAAGSGMSLAEAASAMTILKDEFSNFTKLTKEAKTETGALVGVLDKMGLSVQASAKFLDIGTKSLGMSRKSSLDYLTSLKGFADQSGVSMSRLSADLQANASNLTKFGDKGTQVFKEMELASKQLGMAMSDLFQITEQFTTFSGAAQAAGQLNAVLGGDFLNSVDLLTASMEDPTAVFKQFKEAMDASGKSFDDIDNGMKRVIASSMGMTVEQAGRVLSMDINTATAAMKEQAATQETLNKMSNKMVEMGQRLQTAFAALYPAIDPILTVLADFVDLFAEFAMGLANFIKENPIIISGFKIMATVVGALGFAIGVLGTTVLPVYTQFKVLQLLYSGQLISSIKNLIPTTGILGKAMTFLSGQFSGFKNAAIGFVTSIRTSIIPAVQSAITSTIQFARTLIANLIPSLMSAGSSVLAFARQMLTSLASSVSSGITSLVTFATTAAPGATASLAPFIASMKAAAVSAIRFAITMVSNVISSLVTSGTSIMTFVTTNIVPFITSMFSAAGSVVTFATTMLTSFVGSMVRATTAVVNFGIAMATKLIASFASGAKSAISFAISLLTKLIPSFAGIISTGAAAGAASTAAGTGAAAGGASAAAGAKGFLAMGAAAMMMGIGIGIAALGISTIVDSLVRLVALADGSTQTFILIGLAMLTASFAIVVITAAILGMVVVLGVLVYTGVGPAAAGLMLAIGAAALLMGAGMALAAYGFSLIIDSLANLLSVAISSADSLTILSASLILTAYSITILTVSLVTMVGMLSFLAFSGVGAAAVAIILAISAALLVMSSAIAIASYGLSLLMDSIGNSSVAATNMIDSLSKVDSSTVLSYVKLVEVFSDLADAINEIDSDVIEKLGNLGSSSTLGFVTKQISSTIASIAGPDTSIETSTGNTTQTVSSEPANIKIELSIDSPIMLKENELGRLVTNVSKEVFAGELQKARTSSV